MAQKSEKALTLEGFFLGRYMPIAKATKRSWQTDESIFRRYISGKLGQRQFDKISFKEVAQWQLGMAEKFAPRTCNRVLYLLKAIYNCAVKYQYIEQSKNPLLNIRKLPEGVSREVFLSAATVKQVLAELDKTGTPAAKGIMLLLYTGARKSEILAMRWEHIDLDAGVLTVPLSKSGRTRHIMLCPQAVEIIKSLGPRAHGWVFPAISQSGHMADMFYEWREVRRKLNLGNVRLHDLRHTFASLLINAGHSLYEVQRLLGHSAPSITQRYAHLQNKVLKDAVNHVAALIS